MNTAISNGPFKAKAQEIGSLSDLRLNAPFRNQEFDQWDEHEILKRGKKLFKMARTIWPRPDADATAEER